MVKVSITLPNAAQITLESEESEVIQQVVLMALRDLPRDLMHPGPGPTDDSQPGASQIGGGVTGDQIDRTSPQPSENVVEETQTGIIAAAVTPPLPPATATSGLTSGPAAATPGRPRSGRSIPPAPARTSGDDVPGEPESAGAGGGSIATSPGKTVAVGPTSVALETTVEAEEGFAQFCADAAPLGDMRKVVVAAEGAKRFLDLPSVDTSDLARLFELAGWRNPHNFIQTLRNAARDKYRWLERVPGRSGRYSATDLGRSVTMTA